MRFEAAALTHPGKIRPGNEDNYCFHGSYMTEPEGSLKSNFAVFPGNMPVLLGVFDGMGGYQCGECASRIAAETASQIIPMLRTSDAKQMLSKICTDSNTRICEESEQVVKGRMGSTVAMLILCGEQYTLCNIGDSPVWLLRDGVLTELSYQHTEMQNYAKITGKQPEKSRKFPLTQHLGIRPDEMELDPYFTAGELHCGDRFLLCSDGVTDMISVDELTMLLQSPEADADTLARQIFAAAMEAGGKDNITAVVVCIR